MERGYRLEPQRADGVVRLALSGDIDAPDADALLDDLVAFADEHDAMIVLDASAVAYLGSAGLRSLLAAREYTVERGGGVTISRASNIVRQVLVATGTDSLFTAAS